MNRADTMLSEAIDRHGRATRIAFPDTAYALPVILALVGKRVEKLGDLEEALQVGAHLAPGAAHGEALAPLSWGNARRGSGHTGGA